MVKNSTHVSFALGPYDKTMPLVIDPVLVYGTFLGGLANDEAVGITVDSNGSAYVTGWTQSTAADLRRFLVQQMESHGERRLVTVRMLEGLTE